MKAKLALLATLLAVLACTLQPIVSTVQHVERKRPPQTVHISPYQFGGSAKFMEVQELTK